MPPAPVDTTPIQSPVWLSTQPSINAAIAPDVWRGKIEDLFDWLATNNGAHRKLDADLLQPTLSNQWAAWRQRNLDKVR